MFAASGRSPITTRWIDSDKSHGQGIVKVRSRFVARDFKRHGERDREDLFCATPPLELLRLLVSLLVTKSPHDAGKVRKMLFVDVKKAHLVPVCHGDVYIELPSEAGCAPEECGKLIHWLYGCRKAGQAWEDHYSRVLGDAGFFRGVASPVAFHHKTREMWCVVHGDDFSFVGFDKDLDFIEHLLKQNY